MDGEPCPLTRMATGWRCGTCDQVYLFPTGCHVLRCDSCGAELSSRRGKAFFEIAGGVSWGRYVFTMPSRLHELVGPKMVDKLRKRLAKLVEHWYAGRTKSGLLIGMKIAVHPEGEPEEGGEGKWLPHFHVIVPLLGVRPGHEEVREIKRWWTLDELAELRGLWGQVLAELALDLGDREPIAPNVFYQYHAGVKDKLHGAKYDLRTFPAWSAGELGDTTLLSPRGYGLLSPNAAKKKEPGLWLYRHHLAAQLPETEHLCDCGGALLPLGVYQGDLHKIGSLFNGTDKPVRWRCGYRERGHGEGPRP